MIELRTGLPGAGKTLSTVADLAAIQARWEKHPGEARAVFVDGIKDLALPHAPVPVKAMQYGKVSLDVPDWDAMPDGSLVILDEAQRFFPPRGTQSMPPEHVSWLNVHRHRGFDLIFITQQPKLIDFGVRALVGKHVHYRRLFGGQRSMRYEFDQCSDSLQLRSATVTSYFSFPRKAYQWFKSAEVHTKQSFRLPKWLLVPFIGLALGVYAVPKALSSIHKVEAPRTLASAASAPAVAKPSGALAPAASASGVAVAAAAVSPAASAPVFLGCMASASRCVCVLSSGEVVSEPAQCRESSREFGHLVALNLAPGKPFAVDKRPVSVASVPALVDLGGGDPRYNPRGVTQ